MTIEEYAKLEAEYEADCERIAAECEEEGYPSHGSNYELRVERLREIYPELFADDEDGEEDEEE